MRNIQRLIYVGVILTSFMMVLVTGCSQMSPEAKKAQHEERGLAYFDEGKYQEAKIEYQNVIQIDPKSAQAHYQMALIHMKLGGLTDLQAAFGELTKTVDLDPTLQDAQLKLSEFYLAARQPVKAREHAEIVLASAPRDPKGHMLRGRSLVIEKEFEQGIEEFRKSIELDPDNVQPYIDLARAYVGLKQQNKAHEALQEGLRKHPNSSDLIVSRGDLFLVNGEKEKAEAQYKLAVETVPDNEALYIKLGKFYQVTREWDKAESVYQDLVQHKPDTETPHIQLGDFYAFIGKFDEARSSYHQALEVNPDSEKAFIKIIAHDLDRGESEQAETHLEQFFQQHTKNVYGRALEARLQLAKGNVDDAVANLQRVIKEEPNMAMAHQYLGIAFVSQNNLGQAAGELEQAVKLDPSLMGARNALATVRLADGSYDMAIEQAEIAFRMNSRNIRAVRILGEAYLRKGEVARAKRIYEAIVEQIPQDAPSHYSLGLIARSDKDMKGSISHFEKALEGNPAFVQALTQLVTVHVRQGREEQARTRVLAQIQQVPDNPLMYNLLGGMWVQNKDMEKAESAFKRAIELDNSLQVTYMNLAELYRRDNRLDEAIKEYEKALSKNPENISAHLMLGMIAEQGQEFDNAKSHYEATLKINPNFAPAANNLAWIISEHDGNLDVALSHAQTARAQQPNDPHIADTLGWIYYKKNAYLKATSLLKEAAEKLQDNPVVHYHLGMAQWKKGNPEGAEKALKGALRMSDKFQGVEEVRKTLQEL
ncbi:MAG: tetratricopeptide repeat protein [Nitrospirae bacterium]|nr:tetratricopeptide repeat protein [Nitrospirota bacterium]